MLFLIDVSIEGCATDSLIRSDCDWAQPIDPSCNHVLNLTGIDTARLTAAVSGEREFHLD